MSKKLKDPVRKEGGNFPVPLCMAPPIIERITHRPSLELGVWAGTSSDWLKTGGTKLFLCLGGNDQTNQAVQLV